MRNLVLTALALLLGPAAAAGAHSGHGPPVVAVGEFAFAPEKLTIVAGDVVFWEWNGPDTDHSVTSDAGQSFGFESDPGGPPAHEAGDRWALQFTEAGAWTYHCRTHAFMTGSIEVLEADAAPVIMPPRLSRVAVAVSGERLVVRFRVSEAVSMRAAIRRTSGAKVLREFDFAGPPGANRRRLGLGGLAAGRYRFALKAIDSSTGRATRPAVRAFTIR